MNSSNRHARLAAALLAAGIATLEGCSPAPRPPSDQASQPQGETPATQPAAARRILYYRHPMGLPDTSPTPKRDAMGMDYLPVYADEQSGDATIRIGPERVQKLGVRTMRIERRALARTLRIVGTLQPDENRQSTISPRFEGWITRLLVSTTGAPVRRGQPLLEVYSPDLISAEQDYRVATRAAAALGAGDAAARQGMDGLVRGSLERLRNWGVADSELAQLRAGGEAAHAILLRAPRDGVVSEKSARVGQRFMAGESLFQVTDLASVWLVGSVFEQDLALVHVGTHVSASFIAYPGKEFTGTVSFISPVLQPETRTAQLRVALRNPEGLLKPAMYGTVKVDAGSATPRLAAPDSAVLDTGTRQLVLVDRGGGAFEPRVVRLGEHGDGYTEILDGLAEGEAIVVNGNFLLDSESNLRAAFGGLSAAPRPSAAAAAR